MCGGNRWCGGGTSHTHTLPNNEKRLLAPPCHFFSDRSPKLTSRVSETPDCPTARPRVKLLCSKRRDWWLSEAGVVVGGLKG